MNLISRPLLHMALAVALSLTVAGCASGPPSLALQTVGTLPEGAKAVPLLVATMRQQADDPPGLMFSGERGRNLSYADVVISVPPNHQPGQLEIGTDPSKSMAVIARDYLTRKDFIAKVRRELAKRKPGERDILVFIHGYNTRFDEAIFRFAQIVNDAGYKGVPVLFTWPSRGELLAYPYDRESTAYSRDDLETTLLELARETGVAQIDLLAHSMGNMLTMEVLRQAKIRGNPTFNGKLGYIMLAAPDVDIDVFRRQLDVYGRFAKPVTVFVSKDDKALNVSRIVWGSSLRAGAYTVFTPEIEERLKALNIRVIDLSDVKSSDKLNHATFAASPEIVQMIGNRLASDDLDPRAASLTDKVNIFAGAVGRTVGSAAGLAVDVPLGVVGGVTQGVAQGVSGVTGSNAPR